MIDNRQMLLTETLQRVLAAMTGTPMHANLHPGPGRRTCQWSPDTIRQEFTRLDGEREYEYVIEVEVTVHEKVLRDRSVPR